MFGSEILDTAVGLIFVFLILSLICSAIHEGYSSWRNSRASGLETGLKQLLQGDSANETLFESFCNHPLIRTLFKESFRSSTKASNLKKSKWPSYIPPENFALALMDIIVRGKDTNQVYSINPGAPSITINTLRSAIERLENPGLQRILLSSLDLSNGNIHFVQQQLELWFNNTMDSVSSWYKRKTQLILFVIGLISAIVLNANTITITTSLYQDTALREAFVASAQAYVQRNNISSSEIENELSDVSASITLPIGWHGELHPGPNNTTKLKDRWKDNPLLTIWYFIVYNLMGWFLTSLAITLGAPFWFDLLNKVIVFRSAIKPDQKPSIVSSTNEFEKSDVLHNEFKFMNTVAYSPTTSYEIDPEFEAHEWDSINPNEGII